LINIVFYARIAIVDRDCNPEARKEHDERMKEYYRDNPEARTKTSLLSRAYWSSEEARAAQSERAKKQFSEAESRTAQGDRMKRYYAENPWFRVKVSLAAATQGAKKAGRPFSYLPEYQPK
jgi:hypothetical protein